MSLSRSLCFLEGLSLSLSDSGSASSCEFFGFLWVLVLPGLIEDCTSGIPEVIILLDSLRVDWMQRILVRYELKVTSSCDWVIRTSPSMVRMEVIVFIFVKLSSRQIAEGKWCQSWQNCESEVKVGNGKTWLQYVALSHLDCVLNFGWEVRGQKLECRSVRELIKVGHKNMQTEGAWIVRSWLQFTNWSMTMKYEWFI